MIPKIIHYCWFGRKSFPELAQKCIASWKKFLPEYKIKEWNEDNFDVFQIPYAAQAYKCKRFAFVSDYARFKIMYEYGGIYFDTDVEVIKPLDEILSKGPFFGMEASDRELLCAPGLGFACNPGTDLCREMLDYYEKESFIFPNGQYNLKTVVQIFSEILQKRGFVSTTLITQFDDIYFYPPEYFCPLNYYTGEERITENTYTIHHYAASWINPYDNLPFYAKIWKFLHLPDTDIRGKLFGKNR